MGYFVKKYPDTIAGYNTLSPQRKKMVDIEGLSSCLKKSLILLGISLTLICSILWFFNLQEATKVALIVIPLIFGVIAVFSARKYGLFKKR